MTATVRDSEQIPFQVDAFKFWLMLKVRGLSAFEEMVEHNFALSEYFVHQLNSHPNFRLVQPKFQYTNVCFWYIPSFLEQPPGETPEWWQKVYQVTVDIKKKMVLEGSAMISYCPLKHKGIGNFFRMVFTSYPRRSRKDVDDLLELIEKTGESLAC